MILSMVIAIMLIVLVLVPQYRILSRHSNRSSAKLFVRSVADQPLESIDSSTVVTPFLQKEADWPSTEAAERFFLWRV